MYTLNKVRDERSTYGGVSFEASAFAYAEELLLNLEEADDGDKNDDDWSEEQEIKSNVYGNYSQVNERIERRLMAKHIKSGLINKVQVSNETPRAESSPLRFAYSF